MTQDPKPQFLIDLERDGYVVVPGVVGKEECAEFQEASLKWLESFPYGFKRDDRSTWTRENLPEGATGGIYNRYAVSHEDFVWRIRAHPGIVDIFSTIWGTDDILASFDGMNVTMPINEKTGRTDIPLTEAWPHIDQNARNVDRFELYQGIANLAPNGPNDGGLCVLKGSHLKHAEHFASIGGFRPEKDAGEDQNAYGYIDEDFQWYKDNGCEVVKVCAGEGDLILWDSRTVHWNSSPVGEQTRFCCYVCYCPRSMASEAGLAKKFEVFKARKCTTHWPNQNIVFTDLDNDYAVPRRPDGTVDPANRDKPFVDVIETPAVLRLVGVRA